MMAKDSRDIFVPVIALNKKMSLEDNSQCLFQEKNPSTTSNLKTQITTHQSDKCLQKCINSQKNKKTSHQKIFQVKTAPQKQKSD